MTQDKAPEWAIREAEALTGKTTAYSRQVGAIALALSQAYERGQESQWLPIETAPRDGTLVLLCLYPHPGFIECPRKVGGWWGDEWNIFGGSWSPTHWQPLPAPPTIRSLPIEQDRAGEDKP